MAGNSSAAIFGEVFGKVLETVSKPSVPVAAGNEREVAQAVTNKIAPIVVNATNSEPFYKSRIFIGLATAALGFVASKIGLVVSEGDVLELVNIVAAIIEAAGLGYAWYGRVRGSSLKPLGG